MSNNVSHCDFLIVDDEPIVRLDLATILADCGLCAKEAGDVTEALSVLEESEGRFAGLITDIIMPGSRNGVVLANHAKWLWPHLKIIVLSAGRHPRPGILPDGTLFLPKPINPAELAQAIFFPSRAQRKAVPKST